MPSKCLLTRLRAPQRSQRPLDMTAWPDVRQRKRLCSRRDRGRFLRSTVGGRRSERLAAVALSFALRRPLSQPFQGFTSGARPTRRNDRPRDPTRAGPLACDPADRRYGVSSAIALGEPLFLLPVGQPGLTLVFLMMKSTRAPLSSRYSEITARTSGADVAVQHIVRRSVDLPDGSGQPALGAYKRKYG